jgi:RNA polymerase-binding transcription factor DksA
MPSTLRPPDQPHPDLLLSLPTLRAKLEEQRQFRTEQIVALTAPGEPGAVPATRPGTGHSSAYDQVSIALLAGARQALADIDTALYRMLVGRYGVCQSCGAEIALRRLYAIPQTALCAECHRASGTAAAAGAPAVEEAGRGA